MNPLPSAMRQRPVLRPNCKHNPLSQKGEEGPRQERTEQDPGQENQANETEKRCLSRGKRRERERRGDRREDLGQSLSSFNSLDFAGLVLALRLNSFKEVIWEFPGPQEGGSREPGREVWEPPSGGSGNFQMTSLNELS